MAKRSKTNHKHWIPGLPVIEVSSVIDVKSGEPYLIMIRGRKEVKYLIHTSTPPYLKELIVKLLEMRHINTPRQVNRDKDTPGSHIFAHIPTREYQLPQPPIL